MFGRRRKAPVPMVDNRVQSFKLKKSILDKHIKIIIYTEAGERFEFNMHQGLAWRLRHHIHRALGFDPSEIARGQRFSQWHGME